MRLPSILFGFMLGTVVSLLLIWQVDPTALDISLDDLLTPLVYLVFACALMWWLNRDNKKLFEAQDRHIRHLQAMTEELEKMRERRQENQRRQDDT